ncbi:hypothetical protein CWB99_17480 [Pseudoalteromonas rubra]|uniref:Uncharacterized protein n=1 Tax=Pseudoalteromonas rubra TaxID=43658 RepID=A0A5S3WKB7_9GAMM|nr:hypothetical protein [Pseudoalteromonas rubra]TMP26889.1 hypothetical protein CWB99_17480 [Pseudoalteromonas rubra]TMP33726.1 hypothetical protein CWC00_09465 [Pseudoalteromonas rubra]
MMTKKYFKGPTESTLGEGIVYTEFDGEVAARQVENFGGKWYSSRHEYHDEIGPGLYDGKLSDLDLSDSVEISSDDFELVWQESE